MIQLLLICPTASTQRIHQRLDTHYKKRRGIRPSLNHCPTPSHWPPRLFWIFDVINLRERLSTLISKTELFLVLFEFKRLAAFISAEFDAKRQWINIKSESSEYNCWGWGWASLVSMLGKAEAGEVSLNECFLRMDLVGRLDIDSSFNDMFKAWSF